MKRLAKAPLFFAVALVIALPGCGGDGTSNGGSKATTVAVTLQEFAVMASPTTASAGSVTFSAENKGPEDKHELVVIKTDLAPDQLPKKPDGSVDEDGQGIDPLGEIEEFAPGTTQQKTLTLTAGKYVLICNVVETDAGQTQAHYSLGMRTPFTVT